MSPRLWLVVPALLPPVSAVLAAGPFDGAYSGQRTSIRGEPPSCIKEGASNLLVKDSVLNLTYGRAHFEAPVQADGKFEKSLLFNYGNGNVTAKLQGQIANRRLEADLETYACKYHYVLNHK